MWKRLGEQKSVFGQWKDPKTINEYFCFTPRYRIHFEPIRKAVEISDLIGVKSLEINKEYMMLRINWLGDPLYVKYYVSFESYVNDIKSVFVTAKGRIREKLSVLTPEERNRLNEAIHCFFEGCYYSTIIMSVSAIEFRLLNLMSYANPQLSLIHI